MSRLLSAIALYTTVLLLIVLAISCSVPQKPFCGNYYSEGKYIMERNNVDGRRQGHYLLTIDSLNAFELKEVSHGMGVLYTVCSGYLQQKGRNSYKLKKRKADYPYGALGNPYYNDAVYQITIISKDTIILKKGRWKTTLLNIDQDSIPLEFDFKKFGYDSTLINHY